MSKAVLVLDMPDKCRDCPLHEMAGDFNKLLCVPMKETNYKLTDKKPDWCPLEYLPEREYGADLFDEYETGWEFGWNRCIDEILRRK